MKRLAHRRSALRLALTAVCCLGIAACSSGSSGEDEGKDPGVASVTSPKGEDGKKPSAGDRPGTRKGVMIAMNATDEETDAIYNAWYACLKEHGVRMTTKPKTDQLVIVDEDARRPAEAYRTCADKEPYLDPLLDKNENPRYAEQTKAWMACMNRNGIEVSGTWDDEFFQFGDVAPELKDWEDRRKVYDRCNAESYKW